jgi:hypothetical protein
MVTLVKRILPKPFKDKIKSINRERQFAAAMQQLAATPSDASMIGVLQQLGRAWGEDGYRAVGGYLEEVAHWAANASGPVLEIGSGLTTMLLGTLASRSGQEVWTLEHHPEYFRNTEAKLKRYNLTNVHLTFAPLRDYGDYCWYDPPLDILPRDFGLVIADGPPGDVKGGRFGLLPVLGSHFSRHARKKKQCYRNGRTNTAFPTNRGRETEKRGRFVLSHKTGELLIVSRFNNAWCPESLSWRTECR